MTERTDLLETLAKHRWLFRQTVEGLTEEQIRIRPTASALCLGGLIKHVTRVESRWTNFILDGAAAMVMDESAYADHIASFGVNDDETLDSILEAYDAAAARTAEVLESVPSLDDAHPLPEAPWFEPGASWTARRTFVHIVAETAQHAGHADIIRETIDGAKTMG